MFPEASSPLLERIIAEQPKLEACVQYMLDQGDNYEKKVLNFR